MLDPRNSRTIVGFKADNADFGTRDDTGGTVYVCEREADNWSIEWSGTDPPGSVWATADDRTGEPVAEFQVWPVHLGDEIPEGARCAVCGALWTGSDWKIVATSPEITAERKAEITIQLRAWLQRHEQHIADADGQYPFCGCNPFQDVIYDLPEYDPEEPRNIAVPEQRNEFYLTDGTLIEETDTGRWQVGGVTIG